MAVKWHVIPDSISQSITLKQGGQGITDVHEVRYHIDDGPAAGTTHTVVIPSNRLDDLAYVHAAITNAAEATHGVAGLSSDHA